MSCLAGHSGLEVCSMRNRRKAFGALQAFKACGNVGAIRNTKDNAIKSGTGVSLKAHLLFCCLWQQLPYLYSVHPL